MSESAKMVKKEIAFMEKKRAPKSMIAHEKGEMKSKGKKYSSGGKVYRSKADGIASRGRTKAKQC